MVPGGPNMTSDLGVLFTQCAAGSPCSKYASVSIMVERRRVPFTLRTSSFPKSSLATTRVGREKKE